MELDVFSLKTGRKGISPLIATVLAILFGVTTLGIALGVVNPAFRRMKDTSIVNDEFHTLETLNTAIKEVASESDGSKRIVPVTITDGTLRVNSTYDWLYFEYEPSEAMDISGEKGDIRIEHGLEFADYFNYYADGSKATPTWTNTSGQWIVSGGAYSGTNGTSYHNVSGPFENWKFSASISNVSGTTGGQVFVLPTNPENLVLFLPMDDAGGSMTYDYSGSRNNGTLTNMNNTGNSTSGPTTDGKFGRGMRFDGVNDYVDCGSNVGGFTVSNSFTISSWINPALDSSDDVIYGNAWSEPGYLLRITTGNKARFLLIKDGTNYKGIDSSVLGSGWHHIVAVWDGSNTNIYIDGLNDSQTPVAGGTVNTITTSVNTKIGLETTSGGHYFNGTIDEVMVFNRSLSAAEILSLYETNSKKLIATGTQTITTKTNVSVVLSNPAGRTMFDDVRVTRDRNKLTLLVPFTNVELNGTLRLTKGEHKIQIKHMETNTTTSRPIVELTAV
jgi:hypothetical protein